MANSKKKCKHCNKFFPVETMVNFPAGNFCCKDHAIEFANKKASEQRAKDKAHKEDFDRRVQSGEFTTKNRTYFYDALQALINQYVVHYRDKGKPCCTCGTTSLGIKYDAGHCFTRGARSDLRFELTNIHKQCSVYCNQANSGFQAIHKKFIEEKYGKEQLEKLEDRTQWQNLKERFPHVDDIKKEISRYRKILRDVGLTPVR